MNYQEKTTPTAQNRTTEGVADSRPQAGKGRKTGEVPLLKQPNRNDSIRATYLSDDDMRRLGRRLASGELRHLPEYHPFDFFDRQKENEADILKAYRSTREANDSGETERAEHENRENPSLNQSGMLTCLE